MSLSSKFQLAFNLKINKRNSFSTKCAYKLPDLYFQCHAVVAEMNNVKKKNIRRVQCYLKTLYFEKYFIT